MKQEQDGQPYFLNVQLTNSFFHCVHYNPTHKDCCLYHRFPRNPTIMSYVKCTFVCCTCEICDKDCCNRNSRSSRYQYPSLPVSPTSTNSSLSPTKTKTTPAVSTSNPGQNGWKTWWEACDTKVPTSPINIAILKWSRVAAPTVQGATTLRRKLGVELFQQDFARIVGVYTK